ncbi:MAG: NAD(P)-dependent glycerol-3-phosphate dehydrogenase [Clostridia bacterium]|nr:NAD(P)-dependent glycerol-3-phosphate dehydrogenase [Clostridia bacterium]
MKIAVIGSGGWGLAVAKSAAESGHDVSVWSHKPETTAMLRENRCNPKLLKGITMPENILFTDDIGCAAHCSIVIVAVPSFAVCDTARKLAPVLTDGQVLVLLSKGFDLQHGCCLLSDTLSREVGKACPVVALTGPSHAEEVSRGIPTAVLAASPDKEAAELVQNTLSTEFFRVYTSPDIVSAELGGAMKNIMAVAVGISDGYGFGDNTKALLMTRGIAEISRLGVALGGEAHTFSGLSGVGDLIVTCISNHSRNRRFGLLVGGGMPVEQALESVGAVVEGYFATRAVEELTRDMNVDMPICQAMYAILVERKPLEEVVQNLLGRAKRAEQDAYEA